MNVESEGDALTAAASGHWDVRVAAGQWLAANATPAYRTVLLALLIDKENTAVSMNTAAALLDSPTEFSVSMVMRALAVTDAAGDDETLEHLLFAIGPYLFQSSPPIGLSESIDRCMATADHEVTIGLQLAGLT